MISGNRSGKSLTALSLRLTFTMRGMVKCLCEKLIDPQTPSEIEASQLPVYIYESKLMNMHI